jgi:acyl-CoA thioesterase-1
MKTLLFAIWLIPSLALAQKTLIILGDSLSEGYGVSKEEAYPSLLEKKLPGWKVVNASISGSTSASGPGRVEWALKSKPSVVLVALGGNDGLRGLEPKEMKVNIQKTISAIEKAKVKVLLAGMMAAPNYGKDYTTRFWAVFSTLAKENQIPLYPFLLEGIAGNPKLNQPDGIHPNKEGHALLAKKILPFLSKELL